jgi:formylglycine-generating enzyme required for sulfatase activity
VERVDLQQERGKRRVPIHWRWAAVVLTLVLLGILVVVLLPRLGKPVSDMVKVSAGEFWMGCNEKIDEDCLDDEKPGRSVNVDAFSIDRKEVTVAQYRNCVQAKKCSQQGVSLPHYGGKDQPQAAGFCNWGKSGRDDHPMNCLDWSQAKAYCEWVGTHLPTDAEWEKAARGTDGRIYPWGNDWSNNKANVNGKGTMPVGSFPSGASPYGALDMAGNVWEWVADTFGTGRGVRGGSWYHNPKNARASVRSSLPPGARSIDVGFRCAQ